jgi:hypothetical protein
LLEVFENLPDDGGVLDAGEDAHPAAAAETGLDVDAKHALQAVRPELSRRLSEEVPLGCALSSAAG